MTEIQYKEGEIIFTKEIVVKLGLISLRIAEFLYDEIEKLNLNEREKVFAHYWVIKHYMDGMQEALDKMGIKDVLMKEN